MTTDLQDAPAGAPVVEYDHQGADYAARHAEIARHLQEDAPVAWSEAHGGFWVVTRYADCKAVVGDWQGFSSENRGPGDTMRRGVLIPQIQVPLLLNECDPPLHTRRRMIEAPFFAPKHLRNWIVAAGDYTRQALDAVIESGEIDFIDDLALRVPAMTTLHVAGVDPAGWRLYAQPESFYGPGGTERAYAEIRARLVALIEQRRAAPQGDMASALARAVIDGQPLDIAVAAGMLLTVVTGGFDTATSLLCNALDWLDRYPEQRAFLRENPAAMENAVEEFLRRFPPLQNLARNVTADTEFGGQKLRAGDRVLLSLFAANHDPEKFEDPFDMRFDRTNAREHLAYSGGNHRCLGAPLARIELRHVLSETLRRLPDYRIDRARAKRFDTIGLTNGWDCLPATFTPGQRE